MTSKSRLLADADQAITERFRYAELSYQDRLNAALRLAEAEARREAGAAIGGGLTLGGVALALGVILATGLAKF